jgi:hypothetical protein
MKLPVILIGLFVTITLEAQHAKPVPQRYDTLYIRDLSEKLSARIYGVNKINSFGIIDRDSGYSINYAPNSSLNLGLGVNYKWFGLGIAFNFPLINNDNDKYGKTKKIDLLTNLFTRSLAMDLYMQLYKGFYVENPDSYINDWDFSLPYPQRSDIISASIVGSCLYAFNHRKYSPRAAFVQSDIQKKSAGSFLLGGYFSVFSVSADSAFIPYEIEINCNPDLCFNYTSVYGLGITGGYTHTFVMWKRLYFSLTLIPGVGYQSFETGYDWQSETMHGSQVSGRLSARAAIVYNTDRSYAGITAIDDNYTGNTGRNQLNSMNYQVGVIRFFYGRRFNVNKNKG